jgi:hypothetical protein
LRKAVFEQRALTQDCGFEGEVILFLFLFLFLFLIIPSPHLSLLPARNESGEVGMKMKMMMMRMTSWPRRHWFGPEDAALRLPSALRNPQFVIFPASSFQPAREAVSSRVAPAL